MVQVYNSNTEQNDTHGCRLQPIILLTSHFVNVQTVTWNAFILKVSNRILTSFMRRQATTILKLGSEQNLPSYFLGGFRGWPPLPPPYTSSTTLKATFFIWSINKVKAYRYYVEIKCQLDATEVFIADLIACSTCFGHHYAHHQELKSIIQWLLPVVFGAAIKTSVASSWHFISTY